MRRTPLIATLLVALGWGLPAMAEVTAYDHNGSVMDVDRTGDNVLISYRTPRAGLVRNGVTPGRLLFNGRVSQGVLEGQARIFNDRCGEVDYYVSGPFEPGRAFRLQGAAPILRESDCFLVDHVFEGPNSDLRFTPLAAAAPTPAARRGCLTGVNTTLNMRVGPGQDYGRIAEIPARSCAVERRTCQGDWCLVTHGADLGWVARRFLVD